MTSSPAMRWMCRRWPSGGGRATSGTAGPPATPTRIPRPSASAAPPFLRRPPAGTTPSASTSSTGRTCAKAPIPTSWRWSSPARRFGIPARCASGIPSSLRRPTGRAARRLRLQPRQFQASSARPVGAGVLLLVLQHAAVGRRRAALVEIVLTPTSRARRDPRPVFPRRSSRAGRRRERRRRRAAPSCDLLDQLRCDLAHRGHRRGRKRQRIASGWIVRVWDCDDGHPSGGSRLETVARILDRDALRWIDGQRISCAQVHVGAACRARPPRKRRSRERTRRTPRARATGR